MANEATNVEIFLEPLKRLHQRIRAEVVQSCERSTLEDLARVDREEEGDTIYAVDRVSEDLLIDFFESQLDTFGSLVLIGEGLPSGKVTLPAATNEADAKWRVIVDPIDGTRGLMYQKRSAWILTGVAPNQGSQTSLRDIVLAIQTEIPIVKQHLSDCVWALNGSGVTAERFNRITNESTPLTVKPSAAKTIAHGYAQISRFFPGARDELAAIDEEIIMGALGPVQPDKAHCFEDQYTSSGGQLYELMSGRDRFNADLRPLMKNVISRRGGVTGICCHPYDVCTELIAREAGVIVTSVDGEQLDAELSVKPDIAWVGYANHDIQAQIQPLLNEALKRRGLLSGT
jgi:fructose-1,6-bisphosphatase/inositol monophosphatase family enzyme